MTGYAEIRFGAVFQRQQVLFSCRGGGETSLEAMRKPHLGKAYIDTYLLCKYYLNDIFVARS